MKSKSDTAPEPSERDGLSRRRTTLFDYIRRAMPYPAPGLLGVDDTYAVVAYILNLNGVLPDDAKLDRESLPQVRMPNRDGFIIRFPDRI